MCWILVKFGYFVKWCVRDPVPLKGIILKYIPEYMISISERKFGVLFSFTFVLTFSKIEGRELFLKKVTIKPILFWIIAEN